MRIAYLGPVGTFTEEAARNWSPRADLVPCTDIIDGIRMVERSEVDRAVLPIENVLQGSVTATLDALAFDSTLLIEDEIELAIDLVVGIHPQASGEQITAVTSHPVPLAGCRDWITTNLPDAERVATSSTAAAAQAAAGDPTVAAIVNPLALDTYGLQKFATDVADQPGNRTRFVVVGHHVRPRTGWDRTSVVVFINENRPGALGNLLQVFSERDLDLTKLESRPTKERLGDYCFFIDIAGHLSESRVADALTAIKRSQQDCKILGSYPRADQRIVGVRPTDESTDAAYADANEWMQTWLHRIDRPE